MSPTPRRPDFIVVGAAKAGTTSLWTWLRCCEGLYLPRVKELEFFSTARYESGLGAYERHFSAAGARIAGEVSPNYMFVPGVAERIRDAVPHVCIMALLRNPVDRAFSQYRHRRRDGVEPLSFADAIAAEPERTLNPAGRLLFGYEARGRYFEQLRPFYELFPSSRILVVTFEDFVSDHHTRLRILDFLGVDPTGMPPVSRENVTSEPRWAWFHDAVRRGGGPLRSWFRETRLRGPLSAVKARLMKANLERSSRDLEIPPETTSLLARRFVEGLPQLEDLTGLNLQRWRWSWGP